MKRKQRSLVITIVLATASIGYALFVFLPGQFHIRQLRADLKKQQMTIVQSDRLRSAIQHTEKQLRTVEDYTRSWQERTQVNLPKAFGVITKVAEDGGLEVIRFTPQPPVQMDTLRKVAVEVTLQGDFEQLFAFLQALETIDHLVWVNQLGIQESRDGKLLRSDLTLTIFTDNPDFSG